MLKRLEPKKVVILAAAVSSTSLCNTMPPKTTKKAIKPKTNAQVDDTDFMRTIVEVANSKDQSEDPLFKGCGKFLLLYWPYLSHAGHFRNGTSFQKAKTKRSRLSFVFAGTTMVKFERKLLIYRVQRLSMGERLWFVVCAWTLCFALYFLVLFVIRIYFILHCQFRFM